MSLQPTTLKRLTDPLPPAKVSWRIGQITKKDPKKASALCYIDARDVMERLDEVCGPENWRDSYHETPRGRVICTIAINVGDEWVSKSDGAGDTAVEGEKGGISDAFKRAAVKWGIGRYLYDIPVQYVRINEYKQIEKSEYAKLEAALPGSRVYGDHDDDEAPPPSAKPKVANTLLVPVPTLANDAGSDWSTWRDKLATWIDRTPDERTLNDVLKANAAALKNCEAEAPEAHAALKDRAAKRRHFFSQAPSEKAA